MRDRQERPVPAELVGVPYSASQAKADIAEKADAAEKAASPAVDHDAGRDWLMVRTASGDWAGKVSKGDWASFQRPLADWQVRVLGEAYELQERMDKLAAFVQGPAGASLPLVVRRQMNRQWWAMDTYHQVLRERIAGFGAQS